MCCETSQENQLGCECSMLENYDAVISRMMQGYEVHFVCEFRWMEDSLHNLLFSENDGWAYAKAED